MTDIEPLSLATLGRELDSARRARTGNPHPTSPFIENDPDLTGHEPSEPSQSSSGTSSNQDQVMERPFPLCLVCLTRPPTAVLLPCCHLNLCHLCAPLMIMKHRNASPFPEITSPIAARPAAPQLDSESSRWNQILARATASHPKSRRLSMGGYVAPDMGSCGAEVSSRDLLSSSYESGSSMGSIPETSGARGTFVEEGRVGLYGGRDTAGTGGAKCLMCRSGVQGWLRVYPG